MGPPWVTRSKIGSPWDPMGTHFSDPLKVDDEITEITVFVAQL
jgi:hypothetical protein